MCVTSASLLWFKSCKLQHLSVHFIFTYYSWCISWSFIIWNPSLFPFLMTCSMKTTSPGEIRMLKTDIKTYNWNSKWRALSLVAQMIKHPTAMWETQVWFLGWEDPLEMEMATHSSTLAWKIPWMNEPGRLQSTGSQRVGHNWATSLTHSRFVIAFLPRRKHLLISWLQYVVLQMHSSITNALFLISSGVSPNCFLIKNSHFPLKMINSFLANWSFLFPSLLEIKTKYKLW